MKLIIPILLLTFSISTYADKIASIDMSRAFLEYYKTIKSEMKMREQLKIIEERAAEMKSAYDENIKAYKLLNQMTTDISLSKEERIKKKEDAEAKKSEILIQEKNIKSFNVDAKQMMRKQHNDSRAAILKEIQEVVKTIAEKNDYSLVLDSSGKTANLIPAIVNTSDKFDITDDTLTILNKGHEDFVAEWKKKKAAQPAKKKP